MQSVAALVDSLKKYRILESPRMAELQQLETRFADPRVLGRELVQRGWLTPYQINRLLQDRGKDLVLGSYVVLELLGEGGMGQVLKARHLRLDRIDALKVIRKEYLNRPNALERFEREARAAARLAHPNVITVYDAGETDGIHFLAMEYVQGTDLGKVVKQGGPLPVAQACEFIRQAALGLQHVHERGLVHRDIKPSNLLRTADGTIKLLDLGLARLGPLGAGDTAHSLTDTGTVVGTADFIAPEQARDSRDVDIRADIYSLGCTLYYLLTAKIPFPGETLTAKLLAHQLEEAAPVESLRAEVPGGLADVVRRLMTKAPADRYQTPAEVAAALLPFAQGGNVPVAVPVLGHSHAIAPAIKHDGLTLAHAVDDTVTGPAGPGGRRRRPAWVLALVAGTLGLAMLCVCGGMGLLLTAGGKTSATTGRVAVAPTTRPVVPTANAGPADTGQAKVHFDRGLTFYDAKKYDKAIEEYTQALRYQPDGAGILFNRAECYRHKGELDNSIRDYTRALEISPGLADSYFGRASAYYAKGDLDRCLADNSSFLKLRPSSAVGYNNRGTVYSEKKMHEQALQDFNQAIRLNERYASAYHNRGNTHYDMGQLGLALADFDKAISLEPTAPNSFNGRGQVHHARGDYDKAIADFDRAIELAPKFALAYLARSRSYAKKGNAERADADRRQAAKLDPRLANTQ